MGKINSNDIVLTEEEAVEIIKETLKNTFDNYDKIIRENNFLQTGQLRHASQAMRNYLQEENISIEEYVKNRLAYFDRLRGFYTQVYDMIIDKPVKKMFKILEKLNPNPGMSYNERMKILDTDPYLLSVAANTFSLYLGVENNARLMGYKNLADLNYWRD